MPEIRHGLKMQLLLYLFVVRSLLDGSSIPAGMLYVPAVNPVVPNDKRLDDESLQKKIAAAMVLTGLLIKDEKIVKQIDAMGEHLCISFNKDSSFSKNSEKHIHSQEEFEQLLAYLPKLVCETAEEILRGNIQVAPYRFNERNACTFCTYRAVCAFEPELGRGDVYRDIADNGQAAMEEIAQIVCGEVKSDGTDDIYGRSEKGD